MHVQDVGLYMSDQLHWGSWENDVHNMPLQYKNVYIYITSICTLGYKQFSLQFNFDNLETKAVIFEVLTVLSRFVV